MKLLPEVAKALLRDVKIHNELGNCNLFSHSITTDPYTIWKIATSGFAHKICRRCMPPETKTSLNNLLDAAITEMWLVLNKKPKQLDMDRKNYTISIQYGYYSEIKDIPFTTFRLNDINARHMVVWKPIYDAASLDINKLNMLIPLDFKNGSYK